MEDLTTWSCRAAAQLDNTNGVPDYLYRVKTLFNAAELPALLDIGASLSFGAGQMAHANGPDLSRRVADCATCQEAGVLARMAELSPRHSRLAPMPYGIWNRYQEGGFITWHEDTESGDPRTFSIIALLRAADRGGEFQLNGYGTISLNPGDAVIFPARIFHRVSPVLQGIRESLTLWVERIGER